MKSKRYPLNALILLGKFSALQRVEHLYICTNSLRIGDLYSANMNKIDENDKKDAFQS